ncbi:hypothetical protein PhCBS80983_g02379 [Powellomyces hirtus]|uniref:Restriction endonuclease type IV Mrr domain-containing protein n=1 Tax=Powellomyces hirtus TaxID=109895 RepID=A0A507E6S8_9FUNG|nr:hypothetical protein PhCBS80983_g02379 [Powellomyces hirtus]
MPLPRVLTTLPSTVHVGTSFETSTLRALAHHSMQLRRVGGRDDRGVDLRGSLTLNARDDPPSASDAAAAATVPVIVQCKAERAPLGPAYIRELEGTLARESLGTVAVMASTNGFTSAAARLVFASRAPIAMAVVEHAHANDDHHHHHHHHAAPTPPTTTTTSTTPPALTRFSPNRALCDRIKGLAVFKDRRGHVVLYVRDVCLTQDRDM